MPHGGEGCASYLLFVLGRSDACGCRERSQTATLTVRAGGTFRGNAVRRGVLRKT